MKGIYIFSIVTVFICQVLFPLFSMEPTKIPQKNENTSSVTEHAVNEENFRVLISETDKVELISIVEYISGVVAGEMPAEYEEEALKAQAVAAYTFALRRKNDRADSQYDVTDTTDDQVYLNEQKQREKWGENYETYRQKIISVVESVIGETITYEEKPVLAAYHNISGGKTESAENVWGEKYDYLVAVESVGDVLSPNYLSRVELTADELKEKLKSLKISFADESENWFSDKTCSESGTVLTLKICDTEVEGLELRNLLGLKSSNFDVEQTDEKFVFTVRGHGHGVGMSQYGAQYMALQGSSYRDILAWYYPGTEIK